jgi:hypothetical protein
VYLPLVYTEPGITYRRQNVTRLDENGEVHEGIRFEVDVDMKVYSPVNMRYFADGEINALVNDTNYWEIARNNLGFDLGLGIEYPLYSWLDVGVDIVNLPIPFLGAKINNYMHLRDNAYIDTSYINIADMIDGDFELPDEAYKNFDLDPDYEGYSKNGITAYRPFKMLFYAYYRPFDRHILTLIPSAGFSISRLYTQIGAFEGGLSARLDLGNMFATTLGINYNDRKWKNSIDFMLFNFRLIQIDLGLSMQSPDFVQSWRGAGFGIDFSLKLGW